MRRRLAFAPYIPERPIPRWSRRAEDQTLEALRIPAHIAHARHYQIRGGVPAGHDARWPTIAAPFAEASRGGIDWGELIELGMAFRLTKAVSDNAVCWLENMTFVITCGMHVRLSHRGRRYLDAHQTAGECECFVCSELANDRAWWREYSARNALID